MVSYKIQPKAYKNDQKQPKVITLYFNPSYICLKNNRHEKHQHTHTTSYQTMGGKETELSCNRTGNRQDRRKNEIRNRLQTNNATNRSDSKSSNEKRPQTVISRHLYPDG